MKMKKEHSSIILARVTKEKEKTPEEEAIETEINEIASNENECIIIKRKIRELDEKIEFHYNNTYNYIEIENLKKEIAELRNDEFYYKTIISLQEIKLKKLKTKKTKIKK
jgi:hypothetical protein